MTAEDTATCQASTSTLGYASPCKYDQFDRPILGHINYCPLAMATASSNIAVAAGKHELAHALGFTSGTFAYFRDPTTSPLAPRTTRDAAGTPPSSAKVCADGNTRTVVTPNINTLMGPMTVRDFPHAYKITTPNVVKAANIFPPLHFFSTVSLQVTRVSCQRGHNHSRWRLLAVQDRSRDEVLRQTG